MNGRWYSFTKDGYLMYAGPYPSKEEARRDGRRRRGKAHNPPDPKQKERTNEQS